MPDPSSQEPKEDETPKSVDLSDLKSFSFGTQWSPATKSPGSSKDARPSRGGPRGDRPDRRPGRPPERRDRRPPRPSSPHQGGGPRGDRPRGGGRHEGGGDRPARGGHGGRQAHGQAPYRPYESPVFDVCFYPEDNCFAAIVKAMRANHTTYELFHVAKLFLEKPDRFIASITRKAAAGEKPEKVAICLCDDMPFATEDEAIAHAMSHHADKFFSVEEVEVEAPKGNFPFVNRCPFTKELLGPPNYHKYEATLLQHHRDRLTNMPFAKLQASIETVRDEEVVAQWLETQKKATRYTAKEEEEGAEPKTFESAEDALGYLRGDARSRVVKTVSYARVHGVVLEKHQQTEAFKAMKGERERQQRFPLETANAIRGRMRREKFSIYKKGAKGVTYVCSAKRNFRQPGQVMAPDLDRIISFLESNPRIKAKEFPAAIAASIQEKSPDEKIDEKKLLRDLHWLIADGYVSHFEDDTLISQPVIEAPTPREKPKPQTKPVQEESPEEAKSPESSSSAPEASPEATSTPDAEAPTPAEPVASDEPKEAPQVESAAEPEKVEAAPEPVAKADEAAEPNPEPKLPAEPEKAESPKPPA